MSALGMLAYALNAAWQAPLVVGTAWLFQRVARLGPRGEHRMWLAALGICLLLPLRDIEASPRLVVDQAVQVQTAQGGMPHLDSVIAAGSSAVAATAVTSGAEEKSAAKPAFRKFHPWECAVHLEAWAVVSLAWMYGLVTLIALLRLIAGWRSARRLLRVSKRYVMDDAEKALWLQIGERLKVKRLPRVRVSESIASPVVVGMVRPVLLLPVEFTLCGERERQAAFGHELAHVRRRDCLAHAVCRAAAVPLVWHPAIKAVQQEIAQTREMVCDGIAAQAMGWGGEDGSVEYARGLLRLAQSMTQTNFPAQIGESLGLFQSNKLEERVMKLTEGKQTRKSGARITQWAGGLAILAVSAAMLGVVHLTPVLAQQAKPEPVRGTQASTAPTTPLEPLAPLAPSVATVQDATPAAPAPAQAPAALDGLKPVASGVQVPLPPPPAGQLDIDRQGQGGDDLRDIAVAHGNGAHVVVRKGGHVHRWTGADGQPFELEDNNTSELTPQQERDAEVEYNRKLAQANEEMARLSARMNSPEFKAEMDRVTSGAVSRQLAEAQKEIDLETSRLNRPRVQGADQGAHRR